MLCSCRPRPKFGRLDLITTWNPKRRTFHKKALLDKPYLKGHESNDPIRCRGSEHAIIDALLFPLLPSATKLGEIDGAMPK